MLDEEEREREDDDDVLDDDADDSFDSAAIDGDVNQWCPHCGDIKPHIQVDEAGEKFKCVICNHEHAREEVHGPVVHNLLTPEDLESEEKCHEAWQRFTMDIDESEIKAYSIRIKPEIGDIVRHSKFGVGVVTSLSDTTKAEILFEDGLHRLVCGK